MVGTMNDELEWFCKAAAVDQSKYNDGNILFLLLGCYAA